MDGLLIVNKEAGFTSFDVIAKLRSMLGTRRIGHLGTLDPEAEGVLPIVLGNATKMASLLSDGDKVYEATLRLGITTDTQDTTGHLIRRCENIPEEAEIRACIDSFLGTQEQLPPMVSAKKVGGKKLVDLARKGIEVERKAALITIYSLIVKDFQPPLIRLQVRCSKGTYIRTLCHDIGEKLGCGAAMESLVRQEASGFTLADSLRLDEIDALYLSGKLEERILSTDTLLSAYPSFICRPEADRAAQNGNMLRPEAGMVKGASDSRLFRVYTSGGACIGLYEKREEKGVLAPYIMLPASAEESAKPRRGSVISIGKFDGLHVGHQAIVRKMLEIAERDALRPLLFSFTTAPEVLTRGRAESMLMTASEKRQMAQELGIRGVREVRFTEEIRNMTAFDFLSKVLIDKLGMKQIVVGPDCAFGYGREGNIDFLLRYAERFGYGVTVVDKVHLGGEIVSSTRIKKLISEGDLEQASACLGRPYSFEGRVSYGNHLGNKLGYPTVNLRLPVPKCLPPFGVYASRTWIDDKPFDGMSDLGIKPSVSAGSVQHPALETNLFAEFTEPLYGRRVRTELLAFIRHEKRFSSLEDLQNQLKRDKENVQEVLLQDQFDMR